MSDTGNSCRNPVSYYDYSAKARRDETLPICPVEETSSVVDLNSLFARQVVGGEDYSCAPDRPCGNGACCPKETLQCNYGEEYCGTSGISPNEVCWSNCDAKAECGKNAAVPGQECPLNVCCGKWGFCGMTEDYCTVEDNGATGGCQSNCEQPGPKNKASSQSDRVIGYYESWRYNSVCQGMGFDDIPVNSLTHLFFSFGYITPGDFSVAGMDGLPYELFTDFTNLKKKNPGLKTVVALGGWTFNDPGPTQKVFSDMVSTKENRARFIENLFSFMRQYAFDGVDFDWEYPGADDRGGVPDDGKNFVTFLKELDAENNKQPMKYIVSFTAPTSYWYLRHFDLKAVDYVDFINVMSYDLHGVWDRDNPIGSHIYGHTNLTEMKLAFDLFWRNDVPANKLNMGLGFYGRSFQLENPSCSKPGCRFKGGATKGACSGEAGILSYREIQEIIKKDKLKPYHDKTAGVKYITYGTDQWVSFDDADTFKQKKDLAADLGLGGFLIWAVDQDDSQLSALQAVISPKKLGAFKDEAKDKSYWEGSNAQCYVTECDGKCKPGFMQITEQKCGKDEKKSKLCCPLSSAPNPDDCQWRGGDPYCNGHCQDDEVMLEMNRWGSGGYCKDGNKAYCCKSPLAQENQCYWAGMGKQCSSGDRAMTFSGTVLSEAADIAQEIINIVGKPTPLHEMAGEALIDLLEVIEIDTMKLYCCPDEDAKKWTNCDWHGEPGSCFDNHCPEVKSVQLTDSYFGAGETCGWRWERVRVFCCEPVGGEPLFLPVPLENLFEKPPTGDNVDTDFDLFTDDTFGDGDSDTDDNPSDAAFQFVVLTSPEELQVSLDKRDGSHWDMFNCKDAVTEGEHTVQMVCTDFSESSNCRNIGLGEGVPGTILQMPKGCGPGKYAVAKSMEPSRHTLLPRHLSHLGERAVVYDLTFDYNFQRVPRSMGDTQMRIDFSNQANYWNEIVNATASKKKRKSKRSLEDFGGNHVQWLEEEFRDDYHFGGLSKRELHERWFGSDIIAWLTRMVKPEIKREFTNNIKETFTAKIVDEKWSCEKDGVGYDGHILAQALLDVSVETSFGFTLIVTSLVNPLDLKKSYLTFYNKGEITGTVTLEAVAKVYYGNKKTILNLPFPGASFRVPGIATIGPQLTVEGQIDAELAVAGTIETKLQIASWETRQTLPDTSEYKPDEIGDGVDLEKTGSYQGGREPEFYAGVAVSGDITAKLSAAAEFGIRFDDQWKTPFVGAAVVGEASVFVKAGAGISTIASCPFTYSLDVGARLYAHVTDGNLLGWGMNDFDITPAWKKKLAESECPDLGPIPQKRSLIPGVPQDGNASAVSLLDGFGSPAEAGEVHTLRKRSGVYGPAFRIPVGKYFCPSSADENDSDSGSCDTVEAYWDNDEFLTGDEDYTKRRRDVDDGWLAAVEDALGTFNETFDVGLEQRDLEKRDSTRRSNICGIAISTKHPNGGKAPSLGQLPDAPAYGWEEPNVCGSFDFGAPLQTPVAGQVYHAEHVMEWQMLTSFFIEVNRLGDYPTFLHPNPALNTQLDFCPYVKLYWDQNLSINGGPTQKIPQYLADQYPTANFHPEEWVVLEGPINVPGKAKAWGLYPENQNIVEPAGARRTIGRDMAGAKSVLRSLRMLIGYANYIRAPEIVDILRKQKRRVQDMLDTLDNQILPANPPQFSGRAGRPWVPMDLAGKWHQFMLEKAWIAQSKVDKTIRDLLPVIQEQWAADANRQNAVDAPGDNAATLANKQAAREFIDHIDATQEAWRAIGAWPNPFT
ncbi:Chitin-binding type 1 protein [Neofusicoccum parvum]|uniref:Chitin-binding type 1 protein n=2 Tax=Neofusicoccum parvum TaxID=310453 RepID=A0ACB5SDA7_9PEZI|nr:Chitin-binding type 1 protein [Neofusicoccum parvum]